MPALGKENYKWVEKIEPGLCLRMLGDLSFQYITDKNKIRNYINNQAFLLTKKRIAKEVQKLYPSIKTSFIEKSTRLQGYENARVSQQTRTMTGKEAAILRGQVNTLRNKIEIKEGLRTI